MRSRRTASDAPPPASDDARIEWTPMQTAAFFAALAWFSEGDRALDYFAQSAARALVFDTLRSALSAFRADPTAETVRAVLRETRHLTENRALHRTLFTNPFAQSLHDLLYGTAPLFARLVAFLQTAHVGPQTAAHLLFGAFPDRCPLVSRETLKVIAPTPAQIKAARARAESLYAMREANGMDKGAAQTARVLLTQFVIYEAACKLLQVDGFDTLHGILLRSRDAPAPTAPATRRKTPASRVRETAPGYHTARSKNENDAGITGITNAPTENDLLTAIESEIAGAGFTFAPLVVRRYYVSLQAKPFVILSGLSGTGKTRLTHLFARALCGNSGEREQYLLVPVRPDWTSGDALLGYFNLLTNQYIGTPFLQLLQKANLPENRDRAFFATLDEMNLARVEHYFSDLLSAMEAESGVIPLHENASVVLPPNVFLTGSVNVDEATHPFSRKVLDRANTLEFSTISFAPVAPPASSDVLLPIQIRQSLFLRGRVVSVAEARKRMDTTDTELYGRVLAVLSALNDLLAPRQMHVGYRVRDEVLRFVAASFDTVNGAGLFNPNNARANETLAMDTQILQKILPRLSGTYEMMSRLLRETQTWAETHGFLESAAKLETMQEKGEETGLVSFYD